jgi:hypothetical protein
LQSDKVITKPNGKVYNLYQISDKEKNIMEKTLSLNWRDEKVLYSLSAKYE